MADAGVSPDLKVCIACEREFPRNRFFFHPDYAFKDGFKIRCRACSTTRITVDLMWAQYRCPEGERVCRVCLEAKPLTPEFFFRHKASSGGMMAECKPCHTARVKEHQRRSPGNAPNQDPARTKTCTGCGETKPATDEYFSAHPRSSLGREARCKACRKAAIDVDQSRQYHREWYRARAAEIRAKRRKRQMEDIDAYRAMRATHARNRRARLKGNGGTHTPDDVYALLKAQRRRCWWCSKKLGKRYEVDHRIPVYHGGSNDPSNLVIACAPCNRSKGARMPWELDDPRLL